MLSKLGALSSIVGVNLSPSDGFLEELSAFIEEGDGDNQAIKDEDGEMGDADVHPQDLIHVAVAGTNGDKYSI